MPSLGGPPALRSHYRQPDTRHEQAPGHEDSQFIEVAESAPPGLPRHPPPRPDLRHQQDEPPLQGAPGLSLTQRSGIAAPFSTIFGYSRALPALPASEWRAPQNRHQGIAIPRSRSNMTP